MNSRRSIRALFVDDEPEMYVIYRDNLRTALRDICDVSVEFEHVATVEEAKERLPASGAPYELVLTDMLFPDSGTQSLRERGREVIESALRTPGVVVVAISQGDTTNFPELREEALTAGAKLFRYKHAVVRFSETAGHSGWTDLASGICGALQESEDAMSAQTSVRSSNERDGRKVFVVHGRDRRLADGLMGFLQALGLAPMEWNQLLSETVRRTGAGGNPPVWSIIETGFEVAAGCVVLFTPDDEARLRGPLRSSEEDAWEVELTGQPRQNVLLEAGYALGWNRSKTLIVTVGAVRPISDLGGMHFARLDNSASARKAVAQRLLEMGLPVEMAGDRWLDSGDFAETVA